MLNPYIPQIALMKEELCKHLPFGIDTTAEMLLMFMSKSDDEYLKDIAEFVKVSKDANEMKMLFNFAMSLLQHDVVPIRETIYDTVLNGVKELNDYLADKYGKDDSAKVNAKAHNFINWVILKIPAKEEMKMIGLIY